MINKTASESLKIMAQHLAFALNSTQIAQEVKEAIDAILFDAANESNFSIVDAEIIEISFPLFM